MRRLINELDLRIIPVEEATALRIADIYARYGKKNHQAKLNFGDCFAYDVAKQNNCPLLFVGNDFAQTDIVSAL